MSDLSGAGFAADPAALTTASGHVLDAASLLEGAPSITTADAGRSTDELAAVVTDLRNGLDGATRLLQEAAAHLVATADEYSVVDSSVTFRGGGSW